MNIRASLLAVVVLVIGLAAIVIVGIEKDYPLFTDLFGNSTPRYSIVAARVDSRIDTDARIVSGVFEIDLKRLQDFQTPGLADGAGALVIKLPADFIVLESGIRVASIEYKSAIKMLEAPTQVVNSKLILESAQWTMVGRDLVLVEFDPADKQFTLWLKLAGFMAPESSKEKPGEKIEEKSLLTFPKLIGFIPLTSGKYQAHNVLLDLAPEALAQAATSTVPDFLTPRTPEQISAGEGRSVGFARVMSSTDLIEGIKIAIPLDKSINMLWLPIISAVPSAPVSSPQVPDSSGQNPPGSVESATGQKTDLKTAQSAVEEVPVLVARYSTPPQKVFSNLSKVMPASKSDVEVAKADATISAILAVESPPVGKFNRPDNACDEAAALVDAWQWAAAQVDSIVFWVPGAAKASCPFERLSAILSPFSNDLSRSGGKPEIVVVADNTGIERIREFSPWFSMVTGLSGADFGRYHVEFATFARESLPLGPEVIIAPGILHVLWEHSMSKGPELLSAGKSLTVTRP